ncbi:MAG: response regulator [Parerythrobacter sp.]
MLEPEGTGGASYALIGAVVLAFLATCAALWWLSGDVVLVAVYAGGLAVLCGAGYAATRGRSVARRSELAPPDWSVTVAAIERDGVAVAITDRANRLVCANTTYVDWFGTGAAPPALPISRTVQEELARITRAAWRDGAAQSAVLDATDGEGRWTATAARAGRGEDYLVWRVSAEAQTDLSAELARLVGGVFGLELSRAGIESALVSGDGTIRAAAAGFAERATGDATATLAGQAFVEQLRSDERERIYFAREGRKGTPQTLLQVALGEQVGGEQVGGEQHHADAQPASLMLLFENGIGIGAGVSDVAGKAATSQLEALLGALPLGLAMTDRDGRFLFGNDAFRRAVGLADGESERAAPMPSYPGDLVVREDKGALADAVRRFARGAPSSNDMAVRLKHNPDDPVSLGLAGVRGLGDAAVLLSLADNSEETRLKREVAQATKMQAVGQLAGGVAHDFNNVLTAIIGYCDFMLLRHMPGDSDYDDIQQIRANSNRAASLTRHLLAFSRQQTLQPRVIQLPDVVSEVSQLLKRLLGETIELKVRHDRNLGPVRADPSQLEQVIVNLAVNARDAIMANAQAKAVIGRGGRTTGGRGTLTLATRRIAARDVRSMGSDIVPVGDYTVLVVQDTGGGIPADVLGKIFEPFFTTKEAGRAGSLGGTGLGLSTVYGIVKQSGGYIFADNVPGPGGTIEGARFTLYLPVHTATEAEETNPTPTPAATSEWSGGARILLVEDEDMVRAVADRALGRAGHTMTLASDGEEGLALLEAAHEAGEAFDLIVSDVVMPGMDGPAMVKAIRVIAPNLPVLFMSGYAEAQLRRDIDVPGMHFIAKPFSVQEISDRVAGILNTPKA